MKSLKEALLNRPKNINAANVASAIAEEYINANYTIDGKLTFENVNGVYIVHCDRHVYVKNEKIEKLTDGFMWGEVKGNFDCTQCSNLKSLEGAPEKVGRNFYCGGCNSLTSLEGAPKEVGEDFYCKNCPNLTSLEGAPKKVGGSFSCSYCKALRTLKGAPEEVGGNFYCYYCDRLESLKGTPKKVRKIECDKRLKN